MLPDSCLDPQVTLSPGLEPWSTPQKTTAQGSLFPMPPTLPRGEIGAGACDAIMVLMLVRVLCASDDMWYIAIGGSLVTMGAGSGGCELGTGVSNHGALAVC